MRQEISLCDNCGTLLWPNKNPGISIDVKIDCARATAEDDPYYTETIDLCHQCAALQFKAALKHLPERGQTWAKGMRALANNRARNNG